ncbi:MAG TPA: DUF6484 domain-containing protein [Polyangiaceae bacterium]|nr:DUF6484 domain-containing protein [Polyangiaceae bacterium]
MNDDSSNDGAEDLEPSVDSTTFTATLGTVSAFPELARVTRIDPEGYVWVALEDGGAERRARLALCGEGLSTDMTVAVRFERGDRRCPVIVGLVSDRLPPGEDVTAREEPAKPTTQGRDLTITPSLDGRRVQVRAEDEIVLECGQASITLRRNGRVVVRGTHVETYSEGVNRIKGAQVRIN